MNISLEKCWALLEVITEEDLKLAVYLALNTGLRPSEVLGLELGDTRLFLYP
jgi:integrase